MIDFNVTGISFQVAPDAVALLLQLIDDLAAAFIAKSDEKTRHLPATASSTDSNKASKQNRASLLRLTASFGMVELLLDDGPSRVASVALCDSRVCVELFWDMTVCLEAKLGVFEVLNCEASAQALSIYFIFIFLISG